MDHAWAAEQLGTFRDVMDDFAELERRLNMNTTRVVDEINEQIGTLKLHNDRLIMLDPGMRIIMNVAQEGLGDYTQPPDGGYSFHDPEYWRDVVRPPVLRALGIHLYGAELSDRLRPDSPNLIADQFHPWVWNAAAPLWFAGSKQEAVLAAARSVNARLQQKLGRLDTSESSLCREAFSLDAPSTGRPRLRFLGDRASDTWHSRQQGGMQLGAGCFAGIRNPAAHEDGLVLTERVALEQLAAFSLLARWIDECEVERAE